VDWLVEANDSEKCAVSIFRVEMICWDLEEPYIYRMAGQEVEGEGQSRQVRHRMNWTTDSAPSWQHEQGKWLLH
jgi:hypothetical protein